MRRSESRGPIDVQPYLGDLQIYLETIEGLIAAWIFGSYGTPYQTPLSDLDLALLFDREHVPDLTRQGRISLDIVEILHEEDVSVTILNRAPVVFQFRVLKTGRRIVCRNQVALADFTEALISHHADFIVDHEQFVKEYDRALVEEYVHDR